MTAALKLLLLSLLVFAAALAAERLCVPHIVPIAWSNEPQKLWAVETAFLLRATEIAAAIVAAIALSATAVFGVRRAFRPRTSG